MHNCKTTIALRSIIFLDALKSRKAGGFMISAEFILSKYAFSKPLPLFAILSSIHLLLSELPHLVCLETIVL